MGNTSKTSRWWKIKKKKILGDNNWILEDSFLIDSCPRGLFILFYLPFLSYWAHNNDQS